MKKTKKNVFFSPHTLFFWFFSFFFWGRNKSSKKNEKKWKKSCTTTDPELFFVFFCVFGKKVGIRVRNRLGAKNSKTQMSSAYIRSKKVEKIWHFSKTQKNRKKHEKTEKTRFSGFALFFTFLHFFVFFRKSGCAKKCVQKCTNFLYTCRIV